MEPINRTVIQTNNAVFLLTVPGTLHECETLASRRSIADGEEVLRLVGDLKPDVAVVDISMPKVNGIEVTRRIRRSSPEMRVLFLTIHENEEYVYQMFAPGANGYVVKDAGKNDLFAAVK